MPAVTARGINAVARDASMNVRRSMMSGALGYCAIKDMKACLSCQAIVL